jgi:2-amino-4-hydroxy-6-hydroxymethyldihydropteridine diphosphokinase
VYFGLGSNIDPEPNLKLGVNELRRRFGAIDVSPVYLSPAIGFEGADFLNLVVGCDSELSPAELVDEIEAIHGLAGRERTKEKFNARTLDIDLLLVGDLVTDGPPTRIPRSDVLDCAFVLKPMVDIAPDLAHPETGQTLAEHWDAFDQDSQPLTEVTLPL